MTTSSSLRFRCGIERFWKPISLILIILVSVGFCLPPVTSLQDQESASRWSGNDGLGQVGKAEDLVKDWDKPEFVLFVSGRQHGYIEPCGCITLERQKGGLMRRHRVMKILKDRGWDLVAIDAGNQVRRFGQQPIIKLERTYEALCRVMDYDAIGLGPDDLRTPTHHLIQKMSNTQQNNKVPFTCANATPFGLKLEFTKPFQIIERNNRRIGVTMVVGDEFLDKVDSPQLEVEPAAQALNKVANNLQNAKLDMKVLVAFASLDECRKLAQKFPLFDLVVTAGGAGDPTMIPEMIPTAPGRQTPMIQVGVKGMYVGLVGWYFKNGRPEIKYKRVQLDHRYKDSE